MPAHGAGSVLPFLTVKVSRPGAIYTDIYPDIYLYIPIYTDIYPDIYRYIPIYTPKIQKYVKKAPPTES